MPPGTDVWKRMDGGVKNGLQIIVIDFFDWSIINIYFIYRTIYNKLFTKKDSPLACVL